MRQHVLITGGARGLGAAIALRLAERGYPLVLNYRHSRKECEQLQRKIWKQGGECAIFQADVSRYGEARKLAEKALELCGTIGILVHAAGPFLYPRRRLTDTAVEDWHRLLDGNLSSAFYLTQLLLPGMRQQGFGRIITFGFDGADQARGWQYRSAYAAAKVGLVSLTRTIALEEKHNGITANMICPGDIRVPWKEMFLNDYLQSYDRIGRISLGEDVARTVEYLIAEEADYVTGNVIQLNGGVDTVSQSDALTKNDVRDPRQYSPGDLVYVFPWKGWGEVEQAVPQKNDFTLYTVRSLETGKRGRFTFFHLQAKPSTNDQS